MKRIIAVIASAALMLCMASCGGKQEEAQAEKPKGCEVSMIADSSEITDGSFAQITWNSIEKTAAKKELGCKYFLPEKSDREAYLSAIDTAVSEGAKMIVLAGSNFEVAAYEAQSKYENVYFLLIDGVPHSEKNQYETAENTIGIIFAEEEAGYMAGYAAVKDGYTKLGFMGGKELPSVKRYGYGYVQGAAAAAAELEQKVEIRYEYTGAFEESDEAEAIASGWYEDGVQVIFGCGGAMGKSVIKAAEASGGKVIGVDVDQSYISDTVITSAKKGISTAVETVLKDYAAGRLTGGTAFNYAAKNDGVTLEMDNAKFTKFDRQQYKKLFKQLKKGELALKKDADASSPEELTGDWVTINR